MQHQEPGKDGVRVVVHPIAELHAPLAVWLQAGNVAAALAEVAQYFEQARWRVARDQLLGKAGGAIRATLIRPDGFVAWATDHDPDAHECQRVAARWFVREAVA